eukprot:184267-Chlamydomonas_euryale.AAC.1
MRYSLSTAAGVADVSSGGLTAGLGNIANGDSGGGDSSTDTRGGCGGPPAGAAGAGPCGCAPVADA